jgi:DNA-binding MarR family transcriptional regulator
MNTPNLNELAYNLIDVFALFHKYVMQLDNLDKETGLSRPHFEVLFLLDDMDMLPMSKIGEILYISKPYVTVLVDKLVSAGLVERAPSQLDRRIIHIAMTGAGKQYLAKHKNAMSLSIKSKLAHLSAEELTELAIILKKMNTTIPKLNSEDFK